MLTIRLARLGKKKQPTYRLVLSEKTKDTFGNFKESLGHYNPRTKEINLKTDRLKYWLSQGAKTSATVHNLLVHQQVINAPKVKAWQPKRQGIEAAKTKTPETEKTKNSPTALSAVQPNSPSKSDEAKAPAKNQGEATKPPESALTKPEPKKKND